MQTYLSADFLSPVRRVFLFLVPERGGAIPSKREIYVLLLGRQRESTELFVHLFLLNCPQLKVIFTAKCHILGWHTLILVNINRDLDT